MTPEQLLRLFGFAKHYATVFDVEIRRAEEVSREYKHYREKWAAIYEARLHGICVAVFTTAEREEANVFAIYLRDLAQTYVGKTYTMLHDLAGYVQRQAEDGRLLERLDVDQES